MDGCGLGVSACYKGAAKTARSHIGTRELLGIRDSTAAPQVLRSSPYLPFSSYLIETVYSMHFFLSSFFQKCFSLSSLWWASAWFLLAPTQEVSANLGLADTQISL